MSVRPDVGLERLIHGLEQELPEIKGSAAFVGVKDFSPQLLSALRRAYQEHLERAPSDDADA
jgi:hypothetical protein